MDKKLMDKNIIEKIEANHKEVMEKLDIISKEQSSLYYWLTDVINSLWDRMKKEGNRDFYKFLKKCEGVINGLLGKKEEQD